jgi:polyhydroxyalkanoate synthesis regulator phasin
MTDNTDLEVAADLEAAAEQAEHDAKIEKARALNVDSDVALRNRDEVIEDLVESGGLSREKAEELVETMLLNFFIERVDLDFASDSESLMGIMRQIKSIVDNKVLHDQFHTDEKFFDIQELVNRVFLD